MWIKIEGETNNIAKSSPKYLHLHYMYIYSEVSRIYAKVTGIYRFFACYIYLPFIRIYIIFIVKTYRPCLTICSRSFPFGENGCLFFKSVDGFIIFIIKIVVLKLQCVKAH